MVDLNAAGLGVSQKQLMESSGHAVAQAVKKIAEEGAKIAIIGGRGNNGGDAFVSARFLEEFKVKIYLVGRPELITGSAARGNWEALQTYGYDTQVIRDISEFKLEDPDIIVDGFLGTGVNGPVREPDRSIIEMLNEADSTVISVDVPSGIDADKGNTDISVDADLIVT